MQTVKTKRWTYRKPKVWGLFRAIFETGLQGILVVNKHAQPVCFFAARRGGNWRNKLPKGLKCYVRRDTFKRRLNWRAFVPAKLVPINILGDYCGRGMCWMDAGGRFHAEQFCRYMEDGRFVIVSTYPTSHTIAKV